MPSKELARQGVLDLGIEIQRDVNGIEMGVLENGVPYLTQTGLAKISGVARSVIFDITKEWEENFDNDILSKDRISFLKEYLFDKGYFESKLYIETRKDGSTHYAYPDVVCTAVLEFYAFEADVKKDIAVNSYRKFAAYGLQNFIYDALGYEPGDKWKYHTDRVSILNDAAPDGFFIVFNEVTGLIVDLIKADVTVNEKTIPDISVGSTWANYWRDNELSNTHGNLVPFLHNYPDYYPQSKSNPQRANAYPDTALAEFRRWFRTEYLPKRFPKYILTKANILTGGKEEAKVIGNLYNKTKKIGKTD